MCEVDWDHDCEAYLCLLHVEETLHPARTRTSKVLTLTLSVSQLSSNTAVCFCDCLSVRQPGYVEETYVS